MERTRAAARDEWRGELRRRSRRRTLWTVAGLAAAASLVLLVSLSLLPDETATPASPEMILVEALSGTASTRFAGDGEDPRSVAIGVGDRVPVGSVLSTSGQSRVAFRLPSGHSLRLDASTEISILEGHSLALDRGAVYVDSGLEEGRGGPLQVHTTFGVIQEVGTQFEARLEGDALYLRLREGEVLLQRDETSIPVTAGSELRIDEAGSVRRRAIVPYGSAWDWVVGVTPMLDLEGRSARAFLDWVVRERGWTLTFADESVTRAAGEAMLGGTIGSLSLEEALDAVLPTCRLGYEVQDGVLLIRAAP